MTVMEIYTAATSIWTYGYWVEDGDAMQVVRQKSRVNVRVPSRVPNGIYQVISESVEGLDQYVTRVTRTRRLQENDVLPQHLVEFLSTGNKKYFSTTLKALIVSGQIHDSSDRYCVFLFKSMAVAEDWCIRTAL